MRRTFCNTIFCVEAAALCLLAALPLQAAGAVQLHTGAGDDYPVVATATAGQKLDVLAEEGAWIKVSAPSSVPAWIYGELIRNAAVSVPRAAVRAGPGIEYPVLTKLPLGASVRILQTQGAWVRIQTPERCELWVRRTSVAQGRVVEAGPPTVRPPVQARPPAPPARPHPSAPPPVPAPVKLPPPVKLPQGASVELTGNVERVAFAWRSPARYHLMADDVRRPRTVLAYLAGPDAELARAEGKRVTVTGQQSFLPGVRYPLVRVGQIRDAASPR